MKQIQSVITILIIVMTIGMSIAEDETLLMGTLSEAGETALETRGTSCDSHYGVSEYENASSCDVCHRGPSNSFATSVHNTWPGKLVGVNDFCGAVESNEAMCGKCHGGFGLPTGDFSPEQTDCLICHAPNYKKTATGPDPTNDYCEIMSGIGAPTREYCLRCHATAGGGNNRKRGDLELAMGAAVVPNDLDVHMGDQNMVCQDCHTFDDEHHVAGQGMDLRVADSDKIVTCEGCHYGTAAPHPEGTMYGDHTDKIACTTCHITEYGKIEPAETERNWEKAFIPGMLTKEQHAKPEYVWWNRTQDIMDYGDSATVGSDGTISVSSPGGTIDDPDSKIYAARTHLGRQPWDGTKLLGYHVPTVNASANKTLGIPGNMTLGISVTQGIPPEDVEFTWVNTSRTLGLFHGVAPSEDALRCGDCHDDHALDYAALGYECEYDDDENLISAKVPGSDLNLLDFGEGGHGAFFSNYTGAETCIACHEDEANDVANSMHNTWMGDEDGKMLGVNDFCGSIDGNGATCTKCHTGFGDMGDTAPENVDCLICHAEGYKKTATGPGIEGEELQIAAKSVGEPTREMCLRCHAVAGGGNNRKRGDLELAMGAEIVSEDLDVHMAADLSCQDCHTTEDHKVAGQGMDLRDADLDVVISCDDGRCHDSRPHPDGSIYNEQHTDTLACTACHISTYGKIEPVEIYRDWENAFTPAMLTKVSNPKPTFVWWDRTQSIMNLADDIVRDEENYVIMAEPGGDLNSGKIYAARVHKANQPWDPETNKILPFKVGTVKNTKNMTRAIFEITGEIHDPVNYTEATRTLGLFHGVSPKEEALRCIDCHEDSTLNYTELGFETTVVDGVVTTANRNGSEWNLAKLASGSNEGTTEDKVGPTSVDIEGWTLSPAGSRCTSVTATVIINSTGGEVERFVVLVSGVNTVTGDTMAGLSVQENTGGIIEVPIVIVAPCAADLGTYELIPTVYDADDYPIADLYTIGEMRPVTVS